MSCNLLRVLRPKSGIYVVNKSTLVTDADVRAWTAACAKQIRLHVAPAYRLPPRTVRFLSHTTHAPIGAWVLVVLDDADQADALGYHSETADGRVYGRIFVRPCLQYGVPVSTTESHEIIETFCDPNVDRWADTGDGYSVPFEACDPVEANWYSIDGVPVSDFVYPAWFDKTAASDGRILHYLANGSISKPFQLASGGYVVRRWPDGSEDQQFGEQANSAYIAAKRHALGRATRRMT